MFFFLFFFKSSHQNVPLTHHIYQEFTYDNIPDTVSNAYRVRLSKENFHSENEVLLLQPVSFTLLVNRNLSTAWFVSIPDIEMSGRLERIELLLSQEDYAMILRVLEENLGESIEEQSHTQSIVTRNDRKLISDDLRKSALCKSREFFIFSFTFVLYNKIKFGKLYDYCTAKCEAEVMKEPEEETNIENQKQIHTAIKFELIMGSLVINLFTGGSKMVLLKNTHDFKAINSLSKLIGIFSFSVTIEQFSASSPGKRSGEI